MEGEHMLVVTSLQEQTEALTDYKGLTRKRRVNGERSLSFLLFKTARNAHAFDLVQEESVVFNDGHEYRIKRIEERTLCGTPVKQVQAQHVFFDIIDDFQYATLSGTLNIVQALNHVFAVTDWTYVNQGAFDSVEFDNFGNDNALALFQTILERYGAEFDITGPRQVTLKNKIGVRRDAQFRFRYNIKTLSRHVDTSNLSTYIKGYGKQTKDESGNVISQVTAEYTSPNAAIFGIRHAKPVVDERFTSTESLQAHLQKVINDEPEVSIEIEVVELLKNGVPLHEYDLGDEIYLIYEPLNIDLIVRIMEITDYPESNKSPSIVLGNVMKKASDYMASFSQVQKALKNVMDDEGNLTLQLKRLYSDTNIYHDNTGSWYISPEDPNRYVHIGSGGIDVHRGLIRVERDDGYPIIIGGKLQVGLDVQGAEPSFTAPSVTTSGYWFGTTQTTAQDLQYYTYEHKARYLKLIIAQYVEAGATSIVTVETTGTSPTILALSSTTNTDPNADIAVYGQTITIDFGVPDGQIKSFYVRLKSSDPTKKAYARIIRKWLEG
jgi:phage minor structural protein